MSLYEVLKDRLILQSKVSMTQKDNAISRVHQDLLDSRVDCQKCTQVGE